MAVRLGRALFVLFLVVPFFLCAPFGSSGVVWIHGHIFACPSSPLGRGLCSHLSGSHGLLHLFVLWLAEVSVQFAVSTVAVRTLQLKATMASADFSAFLTSVDSTSDEERLRKATAIFIANEA